METQRIVRFALGPVNCPLLIASVGQNMQEQERFLRSESMDIIIEMGLVFVLRKRNNSLL